MCGAPHTGGIRLSIKVSVAKLIVIALAVVALAGCGASGRSAHATSTTPIAAPKPLPRPAPKVRRPPPRGGRQQLDAELISALRSGGPHVGAYVYDLTTKRPIFELRAGVGRPPASVEKLYTSAAVLSAFGPDARLHTTVLGRGFLGANGTWHGNLYLRGGGDPTFGAAAFNRVWEHGDGPTVSQLAAKLIGLGIRRVTGEVIGDASLFDALRGGPNSNYAPDLGDIGGELSALTYNHGESGGVVKGAVTPGAYAAEQLALVLHDSHVQAVPASRTGVAPHGVRVLATVSSPPMSVLLRLMNVPSDDFFAEMLTKELGARLAGDGSTAAGSMEIADQVSQYGVHPTVHDGSGLSRADRSSPLEVVDLLRAMWNTPGIGRILRASLPLVGVDGTVQRIATGTVAQGRCVAKTGTLNYVSNLAGYCHAAGHQTLAFAFFIDGPSNQPALAIEGRTVADIVRLNAARP